MVLLMTLHGGLIGACPLDIIFILQQLSFAAPFLGHILTVIRLVVVRSLYKGKNI